MGSKSAKLDSHFEKIILKKQKYGQLCQMGLPKLSIFFRTLLKFVKNRTGNIKTVSPTPRGTEKHKIQSLPEIYFMDNLNPLGRVSQAPPVHTDFQFGSSTFFFFYYLKISLYNTPKK